jgi:hypothetical protein
MESVVSFLKIPLCPITRAALGACARACSRAVFHSNKSSDVSALRVNARPSRPSGNNTVSSFLSSLTTTLKNKIHNFKTNHQNLKPQKNNNLSY